jgi:hypothetical protein
LEFGIGYREKDSVADGLAGGTGAFGGFWCLKGSCFHEKLRESGEAERFEATAFAEWL